MKRHMALDVTLSRTSVTPTLPDLVVRGKLSTLKDCFRFYHCGNCPCSLDNFRRRKPRRRRPEQMKAILSYLFRICFRLMPLSDLLENVCDSKRQTLFQSHFTKFRNRFQIVNWIAFFGRARGTVIPSSTLHKPVFIPSAELTGVQQVFF